jgi:hypothetical protein
MKTFCCRLLAVKMKALPAAEAEKLIDKNDIIASGIPL